MSHNLPLSGRSVVVTGAARGLGREIAAECARQGAELILADILAEQGQETASAINDAGGSARFVEMHLGEPESIEAFAENVRAHEGTIDGLVNNAALASGLGGVKFEDIDVETWDRVMSVNVRGTWLVTKAFSPILTDNRARIVNIASDTAMWGQTHLLSYIASKGAVISMTHSLARELGPRGIGVVGLAPGLMRNEATESVPEMRHEQYLNGRAVPASQTPADISGAVCFCISDAALPFTGQVIPTNLGFHIV